VGVIDDRGFTGRQLADVSVRLYIARLSMKLENVWVNTRRFLSWILLACVASAGLAACSSGSSTSSAPSSSPSSSAAAQPSSSSTSSGTAADAKAIAANWTAFFNPKTPVAQRVALLQDGSEFATIIKSQAGGGLAASATAKVTKVTVITSSQAAVVYSILLDGQPALSNQKGVAVNQDGTWKVGVSSFCGLLALENGGKTSSLPAACQAS
jgi:hypothetical protein